MGSLLPHIFSTIVSLFNETIIPHRQQSTHLATAHVLKQCGNRNHFQVFGYCRWATAFLLCPRTVSSCCLRESSIDDKIFKIFNNFKEFQFGDFHKLGIPNSWLVSVMENPIKMRITRGTLISGNPHFKGHGQKALPPGELSLRFRR